MGFSNRSRGTGSCRTLRRCKMNEGFPANFFPCGSVPSAVCLRHGAGGRAGSAAEQRSHAAGLLQMGAHDPLPAAGIGAAPSSQRRAAEGHRPGSAPYSGAPAQVERAPINIQSA